MILCGLLDSVDDVFGEDGLDFAVNEKPSHLCCAVGIDGRIIGRACKCSVRKEQGRSNTHIQREGSPRAGSHCRNYYSKSGRRNLAAFFEEGMIAAASLNWARFSSRRPGMEERHGGPPGREDP